MNDPIKDILRAALQTATDPPLAPKENVVSAVVSWENIQELRLAFERAGINWKKVHEAKHPKKKQSHKVKGP